MSVAPILPTLRSTSRVAAAARASASTSGGMQPHRQPDPARCDDQIVQIAKDGDEIRDQVNGAEGMRHDEEDQRLAYQGVRGSRAAM